VEEKPGKNDKRAMSAAKEREKGKKDESVKA